ncbi:MucBP domain-containing protein [Listeria aquatica]|uniref:MucBP domain-containing protein n=1 Tax=Listeria aquatica TaxID=1494960 RepID=UPI003F7164F7
MAFETSKLTGDTLPAINLTGIRIEFRGQTGHITKVGDAVVQNVTTRESWTVPAEDITFQSGPAQLTVPLAGEDVSTQDIIQLSGDTTWSSGPSLISPTPVFVFDQAETMLTRVYYANAATGKAIPVEAGNYELLGQGMEAGDTVSATAKDLSAQGWTYSGTNTVMTPESSVDGTGETATTTLQHGDWNDTSTTTGRQAIVFWYNQAGKPITLNYVDENGQTLHASQTIPAGNVGDNYDATTPEWMLDIPHYTLKEVPTNAKGTFTDDPQTVTYVYEKADGGDVTVNYQDADGNELAPSETVSGKYGEDYTTEAKTITGWNLTEMPSNATGTFTDDPQTVTYVYEKADGGDVTVNYQDANGNELAPSETVSGKYGEDYTTEAKTITGWNLTETPSNATGTFTDDPQTVTYVYEKADGGDITVNYQDADGNELAPSETVSGKYGEAYTTEAKAITGWNLTETPSNATGTFTDDPQTVTYVYEKADGGDVTVNYQDADGNELAPSETVSGKYGEAYTTEAKTMPGWNLTETPSNATGTFTDDPQTVTYIYEKIDGGNIRVNYVDEAGQPLATSQQLTGKYGDDFTALAKELPGYTLVNSFLQTSLTAAPTEVGTATVNGTFSTDAQTVTFVYHHEAGEGVNVHYVDEIGQKLAEDDQLTGLYGDPYETDPKTIKGYVVKEVPANAEGTFGGTEQDVTYVYEKATGGDITVNYQDTDGNRIAPSDMVSGKNGDAYTTEAKEITGRTLKETPSNASGTFTDQPQAVTYVYEKVETDQPVGPDKQDPAQQTSQESSPQTSIVTEKETKDKAHQEAVNKPSLPKTGDQTAENEWMMGLGATFLLLSAYALRRTKKKNEEIDHD